MVEYLKGPAGNGGAFPCPKSYKLSRSFTAETLRLRTKSRNRAATNVFMQNTKFGLFFAHSGIMPFSRTLTEKLLTFGLGRGIEYYDAPAVRQIVREARKDNYRFSRLISGIVNSTPFQMRKSP